jgi:diaminopimelate decarboxylase
VTGSPFVAFPRRGAELFAEGVSLERIAQEVGTPTYVYSIGELRSRYAALANPFDGRRVTICYALKANMNLAVVRTLVVLGAGADVTSGGELFRALRAGAAPGRIVYSGVGKTDAEIDAGLRAGIRMFNVESRAELRRIDARAGALGLCAPVAFRVNPDVDPRTHPYISTGLKTSKFGIPIDDAREAYAEAKTLPNVRVIGVDCHIGSQLTQLSPFVDALARVRSLVLELRAAGHGIEVVDVGGGLGVTYSEEMPPSAAEYGAAVLAAVGDLDCELVLEPGRWITANAGVLLTRVLYEKENESKRFVVVDAAMNDLIRPALYQSYMRIEPVRAVAGEARKVDVVGPVCESGDFLAKDRSLPPLERGALLAVRSAGAYGFAMSSNYNARPRAAEVLVDGARYAVVRTRESHEDLVRGESIPAEITG